MEDPRRTPWPERRWAPLVYLALFAFGLPWYWPAGDVRLLFGIPAWVVAAIAAAAGAAAFTAWLLARPWPGEDAGDD